MVYVHIQLRYDLSDTQTSFVTEKFGRLAMALGGEIDGYQRGGCSDCDGLELYYEIPKHRLKTFIAALLKDNRIVFVAGDNVFKNLIPHCRSTY